MTPQSFADIPSNQAGDPACRLHFVCPDCGRLREDATLTHCPTCGEPVEENRADAGHRRTAELPAIRSSSQAKERP
jgi:transcription initiation factor IIE alpha subunit